MKQHLVKIWYDVQGTHYIITGLVNEVIGDNGKAIVYPCSIFKKAFGFELPAYSIITLL